MNKHKKMAILVAPILIILGYIASDYYLEADADTQQVFMLSADGRCDIFESKCILVSGEFKVNLFVKDGKTTVNSTFPIDSVDLFLVNDQSEMTHYALSKASTQYYWHGDVPLGNNNEVKTVSQTVRIIIKIRGGQYIAELVI